MQHIDIDVSRTAKAIEYMIIDGLLEAEPYLHIADRATDPKKFLYLTDSIMTSIEASGKAVCADKFLSVVS